MNSDKNIIIGTIYRREHGSCQKFLEALEKSLSTICSENKICYLMGDFNLNLINHDNCNVKRLLDCTFSQYFFPVITKPTRIAKNTAGEIKSQTLLDVIFTNDINSNFTAGILLADLSDHLPVFYIEHGSNNNVSHVNEEDTLNGKRFYEKRIINEETTKSLIGALKRTDWSFLKDVNDTNSKYDKFMDILCRMIDKYIPTKRVPLKQTSLKIGKKPWITKGIGISCRNKNKLYSN